MTLNELVNQQIDTILAACMPLDWDSTPAPPEVAVPACDHDFVGLLLVGETGGPAAVRCGQCQRILDEYEYNVSYLRYRGLR